MYEIATFQKNLRRISDLFWYDI